MADLHSHSGGGKANRIFYESLELHFPGKVDLIQFAENKTIEDVNSFGVPRTGALRKIINLFGGKIHRFTPWLQQFVKDNEGIYQCCIINTGIIGDIVLEIKKYIPKVITIHHNDEVKFQLDNYRPTTLFGLSPYFVNRNQKMAYENSDLNLFLTAYDCRIFEFKYGRNNKVNKIIGVYESENQPIVKERRELTKNKLVITGALHNVQTIKGIKDFCSNYLSLLSKFYDNQYQLTIAGRNPGRYICSLASQNIFVEANPDAVIHCAAYTAVDAAEENEAICRKVNADGPRNIANLANVINATMIHISTDYVFDGTGDTPRTEDMTIAPIGVYGVTKANGEKAVRQTARQYYILRTAWLYGWAGKNFVYTMLKAMNTHDSVKVVADQKGTPTFAGDLAKVIIKIM